MDGSQFDAWLRSLTTTRSRRGTLGLLLSGVVGVASVQQTQAATTKECVPACSECATCQKGICKKKRGKKKCKPGQCIPIQNGAACSNNPCKECQNGSCVNKADNTACNNGSGLCGTGTCNPPPTCLPLGAACLAADPSPCCAGACTAPVFPNGTCLTQGGAGSQCFNGTDCASGQCAGFRCK